jgi:hypothetical protein
MGMDYSLFNQLLNIIGPWGLLIFFSISFILIILLLIIASKKLENPEILWAISGGLYAALYHFIWWKGHFSSGDSSIIFLFIPPYWLPAITFAFTHIIEFPLRHLTGFHFQTINKILVVIHIVISFFVGALIGHLIKRRKRRKNEN